MNANAQRASAGYRGARRDKNMSMFDAVRRAYAEFLTLPTCIIFAFLLLAAGTYVLDHVQSPWLNLVRRTLQTRMFGDPTATSDLLGTIASSITTVTSITISVLLLAVQQAAGSLTHQVFDQFLRRRQNQFHFGFFIGLALYALVTLATVNESFNPVLGATVALLLTIIALLLLLLLLYSTIDQMRPAEIIDAIHDLTLVARQRQMDWIRKTRRSCRYGGTLCVSVATTHHGFVTGIDVDAIGRAVQAAAGELEVVLRISIGSYVASSDVLADINAQSPEGSEAVAKVVCEAVRIERQRDIDIDPAYGIEELEMIGWTSISTAKSDPDPGLLTIRALRDLLARWSNEQETNSAAAAVPVVYQDNVLTQLMNAFESLAVVASESMQHQTITEIMQTFGLMFERLPPEQRRRAEDLVLRSLSALGEHVLTAPLDAALSALISTFRAAGCVSTAVAVKNAQDRLALSVGELNSRSSRAGGKAPETRREAPVERRQ
ncbi:MAG: DUF2254 family protein [Candidatus Binatia bacterium]